MRIQVTHVSPVQTAKVVATFHFVMSWVLVLFLALRHLLWRFSPDSANSMYDMHGMRYGFHGVFLIVLPFIYAICSFLIVLLATAVYNFIAARLGGVEYTFKDTGGTGVGG